MEVNEQTLAALRELLLNILSPDNNIRKAAEAHIKEHESRQGFPLLVLTVINGLVSSGSPQDVAIRQSASVLFKNMVKNKWQPAEDDDHVVIDSNDKDAIKNNLVELMCTAPPDVQKQLSEAVSLISKHDFPAHWQGLLTQLVAKLQTQDIRIIEGVMLTANSIMKRFRYAFKSDELYLEIKFCLDAFQAPLLEQFKRVEALVQQHMQNKSELLLLFETLRLMTRIFFSLNWQDIPEFFEDNVGIWMTEFAKYLQFKNPILVDADEDSEPGAIEKLQVAILENLNLYATKYEDIFESYLPQFTQLIWKLLMEVGSAQKFDLVATGAIKFLTSVSSKQMNVSLFSDAVLKDVVEHIVVKNLTATEADEELFEDNPTDYIRKDMEGSDQDTRRRSASELVRSLLKFFGPQISQLCVSYITVLLNHYSTSKDWRAKDAALHLLLAVAVKTSSNVTGAGELNPNVDILSLFDSHVLPEVHNQDVNSNAIVRADAIKLICIFRSHLQAPFLLSLMPHVIRHLQSKHVVIQTYAAMCIEKFLSLKDRDPTTGAATMRITKDHVSPHFQPLFGGLFAVLENKDLPENDYVMKCIMRTLLVVGTDIGPVTELVVSHLTAALERVCKHPVNPYYNHYLFESVAILVRSCCTSTSTSSTGAVAAAVTTSSNAATAIISPEQALQAALKFEQLLFPPFQAVLAQDVVEFVPYVFQILAQLLCSRPAAASGLTDAYRALFPPLLAPVLWERRGNIPALTDLFDAYISRGMQEIVSGGHLTGVLGVFQKLLASKASEVFAFRILNSIYSHASIEVVRQYLPTIFNLLLHRMQETAKVSKTARYCRLFLQSISVFAAVYDPQALCETLEGITPGLISMIVLNVWSFNREQCAAADSAERKVMLVGITRMLVEPSIVQQKPDVWGALLRIAFDIVHQNTATGGDGGGSSLLTVDEHEGTALESVEFDSAYSKLAYATLPEVDSCASISNPVVFFASKLGMLLKSVGGAGAQLMQVVGQVLQPAEAATLQGLLQAHH